MKMSDSNNKGIDDGTRSPSSAGETSKSASKRTSSPVAPTRNDVLLGRGQANKDHPGNILFQDLIRDNRERYFESQTPWAKKLIIFNIYDQIVKQKGGRFLLKEASNDSATGQKDAWTVLSVDLSRRKIAHAIQYRQRCTMTVNTTPNRFGPSKTKHLKSSSPVAAEPDLGSKPFSSGDVAHAEPNPTIVPVARHLFHLLSQFPDNESYHSPMSSEMHTSSHHAENAFTNLTYQMSPESMRRYRFLEEQTREAMQQQLPYISDDDLGNYNSFFNMEYYQHLQRKKMSEDKNRLMGPAIHHDRNPMSLLPERYHLDVGDKKARDNEEFDEVVNKSHPSLSAHQKPTKNIVSPLQDQSLFDLLDIKRCRARIRDSEGLNQLQYELNRNIFFNQEQYRGFSEEFELNPRPASPHPTQVMTESHIGTMTADPMKEDLCPTPESSIHRRICSPRISDSTADAGYNSTISLTPTTPQQQPVTVSLSDLYEKKPELFLHDDW